MQAQAPQFYAAGGCSNGNHGAPGAQPPEEITKVAEDFCNRYPVDANAMDYLLTSSPEVQARVVQEFRPPREGEGDYSALLTAFVKRCRGDARGAGPPPQAVAPQPNLPALGSTIMGAGGKLLTLSPSGVYVEVQSGQQQAMNQMPAGGYGGRQEQRYAGGGGGPMPPEQPLPGTLDAFLQRYPIDERALDYFSCQRAEVQERVLRDFRPPREGDNDYSSLFMSFVKRCRGDASRAAAAAGGGPQPMGYNPSIQRPLVFATPAPLLQGGGAYISGLGQPPQPTAGTTAGLDALAARYPIDDRAYDYFSTCSFEVQERVLRDFRPPKEGEADYSSLFMSFVKRCRSGARQEFHQPSQYAPAPSMQQQYQGSFNGGSGLGGTGSVLGPGPEGLEAFRQRFPIDERAMAYLSESSDEVRERVLNTFVPPQADDVDFSAPVTAYVRECRRLLDSGSGGQLPHPSQQPEGFGGFSSPGAFNAAPTGYGAAGGTAGDGLSDELNSFVQRYPVDGRAMDYLGTCSAFVQGRVIREFKPKQEGEADYSPLVMAFTKRIKGEERSGGIPAPGGFPEPPWKRQRAY